MFSHRTLLGHVATAGGALLPPQILTEMLARGLRILVVDDEALIRKSYAQVLRGFSYQTETAEDGAAAWEALQVNGYDLLVTDHNMPRVSGVELIKMVRSAHMALPVILASGNLPMRELEQNAWLQPVATLVKPFTGEELLNAVKKVLREADSAREQTELLPIFSQGVRPPSAHRLQPRLSSASLVH
jgi:DNA-binding NtrC family response regulator